MRRSIELGKQAAYVELEREAALTMFNGRLIFSHTPRLKSTNRKPANTPVTNRDELSGGQNINTQPLSGGLGI